MFIAQVVASERAVLPKKLRVAARSGPESGIQGEARVRGGGQAWFNVAAMGAAGGGSEPTAALALGRAGKIKIQVFQFNGRRSGENLGASGDGGITN
jgi:hypothetical protein